VVSRDLWRKCGLIKGGLTVQNNCIFLKINHPIMKVLNKKNEEKYLNDITFLP